MSIAIKLRWFTFHKPEDGVDITSGRRFIEAHYSEVKRTIDSEELELLSKLGEIASINLERREVVLIFKNHKARDKVFDAIKKTAF